MAADYIGSALKYANDEYQALKYLGSKPDKNGYFRMKRGGVAKIKDISIITDGTNKTN